MPRNSGKELHCTHSLCLSKWIDSLPHGFFSLVLLSKSHTFCFSQLFYSCFIFTINSLCSSRYHESISRDGSKSRVSNIKYAKLITESNAKCQPIYCYQNSCSSTCSTAAFSSWSNSQYTRWETLRSILIVSIIINYIMEQQCMMHAAIILLWLNPQHARWEIVRSIIRFIIIMNNIINQ